jgi:hypothetical protein
MFASPGSTIALRNKPSNGFERARREFIARHPHATPEQQAELNRKFDQFLKDPQKRNQIAAEELRRSAPVSNNTTRSQAMAAAMGAALRVRSGGSY